MTSVRLVRFTCAQRARWQPSRPRRMIVATPAPFGSARNLRNREEPLMTPQDQWTAVDRYFTDLLIPPDPALDEAMRASVAAGLPSIAVSPAQGKFLHLLARVQGARNILEIGTLGGYSTIWL